MNTSFRVVAAYALYLDFFDTVCSYKCHTILPYAYSAVVITILSNFYYT